MRKRMIPGLVALVILVLAMAEPATAAEVAAAPVEDRALPGTPWLLLAALAVSAALTVRASRFAPRAVRVRIVPPKERGGE